MQGARERTSAGGRRPKQPRVLGTGPRALHEVRRGEPMWAWGKCDWVPEGRAQHPLMHG